MAGTDPMSRTTSCESEYMVLVTMSAIIAVQIGMAVQMLILRYWR